MWTPLNRADEIAQEIVKLAQRDPEWAAIMLANVLQIYCEDKNFRKMLHDKPRGTCNAP